MVTSILYSLNVWGEYNDKKLRKLSLIRMYLGCKDPFFMSKCMEGALQPPVYGTFCRTNDDQSLKSSVNTK